MSHQRNPARIADPERPVRRRRTSRYREERPSWIDRWALTLVSQRPDLVRMQPAWWGGGEVDDAVRYHLWLRDHQAEGEHQ